MWAAIKSLVLLRTERAHVEVGVLNGRWLFWAYRGAFGRADLGFALKQPTFKKVMNERRPSQTGTDGVLLALVWKRLANN